MVTQAWTLCVQTVGGADRPSLAPTQSIGARFPLKMRIAVDGVLYLDVQGELSSPAALTVDMHVAVFGRFTDDGQAMAAETVVILPPPAN